MKIQAFLKIAVVATAALAAYAFSGNTNSQQMFTRSDNCQNITAGCSNDPNGVPCMILVDERPNPIEVLDTHCVSELKHDNSNPVNWSYVKSN